MEDWWVAERVQRCPAADAAPGRRRREHPPHPAPTHARRTAVDVGEGRGVGAAWHVDLPRAVEQHEGHGGKKRAHELADELRAEHRARRGEADVARPAHGRGQVCV